MGRKREAARESNPTQFPATAVPAVFLSRSPGPAPSKHPGQPPLLRTLPNFQRTRPRLGHGHTWLFVHYFKPPVKPKTSRHPLRPDRAHGIHTPAADSESSSHGPKKPSGLRRASLKTPDPFTRSPTPLPGPGQRKDASLGSKRWTSAFGNARCSFLAPAAVTFACVTNNILRLASFSRSINPASVT